MKTLDWPEVDDILVGATVYGCGGGGELEEGRELLRTVYDGGRAVTLAAPDELAGDTLVACPYGVGGMVAGAKDFYGDRAWAAEHPAALAVRALAEHVGRDVGALMTGELGGTSIADAFVPAAVLGLPIVDADPVGRAVPELQHSMFFVHGVKLTPQVVVNEIGDTVIISRVADGFRAEALARALAVASRNLVWVVDHPGTWAAIREIVQSGAISRAQRMGAAVRQALARRGDAAAAIAAAGGGEVLFRGVLASNEWVDRDGFTVGDLIIDGEGADAGVSARVWFKNENMAAWRDEIPVLAVPDLLIVVGSNGMPVPNPFAKPGERVTVVGLPAPPAWRTPRAVEVFGPRALGLDFDYVAFSAGQQVAG